MRYFKTRLHYIPMASEKVTRIKGFKATPNGPKEVLIGMCLHYWPSQTTHWLVWGVRHTDNAWLRGEHERLHANQ